MDFMFEDEVDEVGSDVEAYCPKCKGDTTHVVISKYEDEIRRVQCNPCGDVHSFRKPRGDVEDDVPEPIAAKKRAMMKKVTWEEFFHKHGEKGGKPYEFREAYHDNVIVTHPKFGRGFVSEVLSDSKVEITFKDSRRVLVHNRKDMPGLPLAAEGDGRPSNTKVPAAAKAAPAAKGKAAKEAPAPAPAKESAKDHSAKDHSAKDQAAKDHHKEKDDHGHKAPAKGSAPKANISPAAAAKNRKAVVVSKDHHARPAKAAPTHSRSAKPARAVNDSSAKRTGKLAAKSAAKKSKK
jgi:hypothetical protein